AFLHPLPVGRLWGIGPVAEERLRRAGFATVGDVARADPDTLVRLLGETLGRHAAALARGQDERPVEPARAPVSYSEENTFDTDVSDRARLRAVLLDHAESVARRLRRDGWLARTVVLKVKLARRKAPGPRGYPVLTRRATLPEPSSDGATFARVASELLERTPAVPVRLIGVGATNLVAPGAEQLALFGASPARARAERLAARGEARAVRLSSSRSGTPAWAGRCAPRARCAARRTRCAPAPSRGRAPGRRRTGRPAAARRAPRAGSRARASAAWSRTGS